MNGKNTSKAPTIYDIAELANTSASTVSAVLNDKWQKRRISKKLAEKILQTAANIGYTMNVQAQALRKEKSGMLGMIVPMYDNRYFGEMVQTFEKYCLARNYFPLVTCTFRDPGLEFKAAQSFLSHRVEAIICTGATDPDRVATLCQTHNVPTINLDLPGTIAPSVMSDNFNGSKDLTHGLIDVLLSAGEDPSSLSGELVFIGGDLSDANTTDRLEGFTKAQQEAGIAVDKSKIYTNGYELEAAEAAMEQFRNTYSGLPTGIFVNSTISLEGVIRYLTMNQIKETYKARIVCFDWDPIAKMLFPEMLMAKQNVNEMIEKVFHILENGRYDSNIYQYPVKIIS